MDMPASRLLRRVSAAVVFAAAGVALMWWLYRDFDFHMLASVFGVRGNYVWMVQTLLFGIAANVFRSLRWQLLLSSAGIRVKTRRAVELVFISYLINSVTPRLGELTRCLLVKRGNAALSTRALGTVVVEKLADVCCLGVLLLLAFSLALKESVPLFPRVSAGLWERVPGYAVALLVAGALCLAAAASISLRKRLHAFFLNLWRGIAAIARLERPGYFAALCAAIWTCNFMQLYLLIPCFDALSFLGWREALQLFATASVGMLLPVPGGTGPWHYAIVATLTKIYGVSTEAARAFALVTHGLRTVLVMLLGILAYVTFYGEMLLRMRRRAPRRKHEKPQHTSL